MRIRVLVADDHGIVRQGLEMYLELDPEVEIVGQAADGIEALRLARELEPDVILMDLLMPKMDGVAATRAIRRELPEVEVIALTSVLDESAVFAAMQAGAIGFLLKDTDAKALCRAIKAAAAGQVQLSRQIADRLMREDIQLKSLEKLTEREREVLQLLASGKSNKEIASALSIAEKTVKTHVSNILAKLNVTNRTQAALYAVRVGLVLPDHSSSVR